MDWRCFPRVRGSSEPLGAGEPTKAIPPSRRRAVIKAAVAGGREGGSERGGERRDKGRERVRGEDTPIPVPWHCMLL